jgi:hypothetical protein
MITYLPLLSIWTYASSIHNSIQAAGTPPPAATPVPIGQPFDLLTSIPWGLVVVFIVAGFIITAIKKNNPNQVTVNCCMPLIDEEKMEIEKQKIAEEEANNAKS